jgi:hypothetical protein
MPSVQRVMSKSFGVYKANTKLPKGNWCRDSESALNMLNACREDYQASPSDWISPTSINKSAASFVS